MTSEEVDLIEQLIRVVISDCQASTSESDIGDYLAIDRIKRELVNGPSGEDSDF